MGSIGEKTGITLNFDISHDTLEGGSPWVPCSSATNLDFDDCLYNETTKALLQEFGCRNVLVMHVQSGASGCEKGFGKCFLRVPQAVWLNCNSRAAQARKGSYIKHFTKPLSQPVAPDCSLVAFHLQGCPKQVAILPPQFNEIFFSPPYFPTMASTTSMNKVCDEKLSAEVYKRYDSLITEEQHKICTKQVSSFRSTTG